MVANYLNSDEACDSGVINVPSIPNIAAVLDGSYCTLLPAESLTTVLREVDGADPCVCVLLGLPSEHGGLFAALMPEDARDLAASLVRCADRAEPGKAAA